MPIFGKQSIANLNGVHPNLVRVLKESIKECPVDFSIVEGVRSLQRQQALYKQGRTTKGDIVTYADGIKNKSNHQLKNDGFGYAVDVYPYYSGKVQYSDVASLRIITDHIKGVAKKLGIKITCGIDWKKPFDPPHIQLS